MVVKDTGTWDCTSSVARIQKHAHQQTTSELSEIVNIDEGDRYAKPPRSLTTPQSPVEAGGAERSMLELTLTFLKTEVMNPRSALRKSWQLERYNIPAESVIIYTLGLGATATAILIGFVFARVVEEVVLGPLRFLGMV